ncbi:dnaJ homolog subfamily C member 22 isoform X2 [Gadus macrocephalus]|uniref:dnaJ homolog subfamily C member 22 isoform X2 n=1 Tax=Gadus macrocephalus TaxID=80720 RepID=UPI0028CB7FCC|nr:dnaJ homolog subfamily C member 22 isoform X2 [Gadus macrocephalus]
MGKRLTVAYALWAAGGPLGLHHIYLGRDSHALLWMLTFGGFGIGWAREFIRIPAYVNEANQETAGVKIRRQRDAAAPPPIGLTRLAGQTSDIQKTMTACLITSPIFYGSTLSPLPISLVASVTAAQHRRFKSPRPARSTHGLGPRLYKLGMAWLAFSAPLGYCIFHNTTATVYYISDCLAELLNFFWFFPWLRGFVEYMLLIPYRILCAITGGGYTEEAWKKVLEILLREYTEREIDALHVLSLKADASVEEIAHTYRELAKTWHPDHNPSKEAEAMFIKIHDAYEVLRRHKPNRFK